jgi:acyl-CoA synthetase (AMP-forming)/AMP-acid ligase II
MSFTTKHPVGKMPRSESAFHKNLTASERQQVLLLTSLREVPKSRYATQLALTQMPAGRGRKAVFSHIEVYKMVEGIANQLRETGVRPGTVCAMVTPNSIEAVVYFLALQWIGAIAAPINPELTAADMKSVAKAVGAFTVVSPLLEEGTADKNGQDAKVVGVAKELDLIHWNIYRSTNKGVQLEQHGRRAGKDAAWRGGAADFKLDPSEVSVHIGTPGSFNDQSPRGGVSLVVPLSHANLATAAKTLASTYGLTPDDATVMTTSLCSIHSIVTLIGTLYSGGHIVIPGPDAPLSAAQFYALAKESKVTWVSADSAFVESMHDVSSKDKTLLGGLSLAFVRCHDGRVSAASAKAFEASTKAALLECYGTSETSGMVTANTEACSKAGTAGRAVAGVQIAVFDPETGQKVGPGVSGDIGVCGATATPGYLNNDQANEACRVQVEDEDGSVDVYVLTGNRGTLDADGFLCVDGDSRELRAAEEEVRSQRMALAAVHMEGEKAREAAQRAERERLEEAGRREREAREAEDAEKRRAREAEEAAERRRRQERDEEEDKQRALKTAAVGARGLNGDSDAAAMSKILERLQSIEVGQKKMEDDLRAKHAAEMAEMQRLLEETQSANRLYANREASAAVSPVLNVNMDEVNAAVNAASMAAQDSSRHTAEAAEAAKRAAASAEEAAKSRGAAAAPLDLNASKIVVNDPNNVQKSVTVSLDEVEEAMMVHPAVGVCRAFGRPDPRFGAEVYCCVLPKKGARVSEPWLKLHAQSVLPAACVPKKFFYREDLRRDTERAELSKDENLKRISHLSGYSTTKMVKSPAWSPGDTKKAAA